MKCVILDDEPFAHDVLKHYIAQTPGMTLVAQFRNAVEAFEYLESHQIDLLFLDIEMPLINGISFLKALKHRPSTIFTTAFKDYAFEGFELGVADYLLKPFSYERFIKAIDKLSPRSEPNSAFEDQLVIRVKDSYLTIKQRDIRLIEGNKDYIKIITTTETYLLYHTLKGILDKLNQKYFIQSHRSYLVNKLVIARIVRDSLVLNDQQFIPIGQAYKKQLMEKLGI
ncbi:response regulator transcription factor [Pedobacter riviphilus]|uniref:Response regulator transcription factor n=1 Tax=Pedobacter riviphilus TaxID=2766984 RepID=A0ABX6TJA6_9SPHI|nr:MULTISPECIES: LytTR family DNA-binding domain-containing protein [Pedobacter]NMN35040.1 DNA-binding LytR/AlgR family response regulator [Pedobacter sp. SG918]QNR85015.1 response regulator transcription factor [Pedobacter riviphilus]